MNRLGLSRPADTSAAGLQPLAEEEPEGSEGNSTSSGSPEEAAAAECENSVPPKQQQVAASMLMTEHVNADSRSPPSVESSHAAKTSSDLRDGQGCSSMWDSLDDQQCGKQALSPTISLVGPCAVSEPTAADSRDQPIVGAQTDRGLCSQSMPVSPPVSRVRTSSVQRQKGLALSQRSALQEQQLAVRTQQSWRCQRAAASRSQRRRVLKLWVRTALLMVMDTQADQVRHPSLRQLLQHARLSSGQLPLHKGQNLGHT